MAQVSSAQPLVSIRCVSKRYPGVLAVDDVSLDLFAGEVHGLVGENGAGKSTLIKLLAGAVARDQGEILVRGRPAQLRHVWEAQRLGLAFIHQELNLIPYFTVVENIFLGHPYPQRRWGSVDWRRLRARAQKVLEQLGANLPLDLPVSHLSPGQQTLVSIAHALAADADLIVMDEPTASLTEQEIEHLFAVIRTLQRRGVGVLYISHRLAEIFAITQRITVMRNGRVVTTQPTAAVTERELVQWMTGRAVDAIYPPRPPATQTPLLTVEGLSGYVCRDISFTLHRGEVLGVAGLIGSGRSELLRMLFGAAPVTAGSIYLHSDNGVQPIRPRSPAEAYRLGLALAPEERRSQGLVLTRPIYENTTLTFLRNFARGGWLLDRRREIDTTVQLGARLALRSRSPRQAVAQLSGGNQQKVVFARALAGEVRVLLLDEPTRGVDVGAKQDIYRIIRDLTAQGVGVLLVSSELPEVLGLAHRLLVLREGRQVATLDAGAAREEEVLGYCFGVGVTQAP
ncbi:MAG: sugar ABC transporter ATP-binding protein [Caldilinea sp.]|nr:sugar ABC transporter ATP-binding protein [Caldilinea sp.]MDW8440149.1 sugar ABC transporter ATP-binding protein [Caldilineaceae bacterium]